MRKIRDVLQLTASGLSSRKVAASLSIGGTTVIDCLQRIRAADVSWPLPEGITDEILEARLYPAATAIAAMSARRPPPWVDRDRPRAPLRQPRKRSAPRAAPTYRLRGRHPPRLTSNQNTEMSNGTQRLVTHAHAKLLGIDRNR